MSDTTPNGLTPAEIVGVQIADHLAPNISAKLLAWIDKHVD